MSPAQGTAGGSGASITIVPLTGSTIDPGDMSDEQKPLTTPSSSAEVDAFLRKAATLPKRPRSGARGRLLFAMDATASREPTWDRAARIQAEMFEATAELGGLEVQLCYYRGFLEFEATPWVENARELAARMTRVRCAAGQTQIGRVLEHARDETGRRRVNALVFVGDCMEEDPDRLAGLAGELGLLGVPAFVFQEGRDPVAERTFRDIARLTKGAWCRFDAGSAEQLKSLLGAVAAFAAGGRPALEDLARRRGGVLRQLTHQVGRG
jgi:hypothetical protein